MIKFKQKSTLLVATLVFTSNFAFAEQCIKPNTIKNYDSVGCLHEQLAKVVLNGKSGFIDKNGKEIIPLQYKFANNFYQGMALVELSDKNDYRYSMLNDLGNAPPLARRKCLSSYDHLDEYIGENLIYIEKDLSKTNNYRFINKMGKEIIKLKYNYVGNFNDGLAKVKFNNKWGFINKIGEEVISLKYDYVENFSNGIARVQLNDKWAFIDKTGKIAFTVPLKYNGVWKFNNGRAIVRLNNKYGFIDKTGTEIIPPIYDDVENFKNGFARTKLQNKCITIDKQGNIVNKMVFP